MIFLLNGFAGVRFIATHHFYILGCRFQCFVLAFLLDNFHYHTHTNDFCDCRCCHNQTGIIGYVSASAPTTVPVQPKAGVGIPQCQLLSLFPVNRTYFVAVDILLHLHLVKWAGLHAGRFFVVLFYKKTAFQVLRMQHLRAHPSRRWHLARASKRVGLVDDCDLHHLSRIMIKSRKSTTKFSIYFLQQI